MISAKFTAVFASAFLSATVATYALPTLQLDIPGGFYNSSDETTYATSSHFNVVALLNGTLDTTRTYYISAAIEPRLDYSSPAPNVGSFKINGTTFTAATMYWGKPPANILDSMQGNLPTHDEFPTYYAELAFHFDSTHKVPAYNTQDGSLSPGSLYSYSLSVDTSSLLAGYSVHFDLYDEAARRNKGDYTLDDFAPFSHDAQSGTGVPNQPPPNQVPDNATTCLLLGIGLVAMSLVTRVRSKC